MVDKLSIKELKRLVDEEVLKEDGLVFKCTGCSNLRLENSDWLITLDLPSKMHPDFKYHDATCSYCRTDNFYSKGDGI